MSLVSSRQNFILRRGRVPAQRRQHIRRIKSLEQLYKKFDLLLKKEASWLGVYGMVGCGKSQLVINLLWEKPEICLAHFTEVFWLTDRNIEVERLTDLARDAFVLLANTLSTIVGSDLTSLSCDLLGEKLYSLLNYFDNSSKILFVIDGVINVETIRFFEQYKTNNCFFIVTSTSREIYLTLENPVLFYLNTNDVTLNDWAQMAQTTGVQISLEYLKEVVNASGSNLCLMDKIFNLARESSKIISSLLHRLRYRPLSELSCTTSYYHSNLEVPIECCFKNLPERICNAFDRFVIFEPSFLLDFQVLLNFWPMDLCGLETKDEEISMVKQDLQIILWNSLLETREKNSLKLKDYLLSYAKIVDNASLLNIETAFVQRPNEKRMYFVLHPLISSFLVHNRPNSYIKFKTNINSFIVDIERYTKFSQNDVAVTKYFKSLCEHLYQRKKYAELLCENKLVISFYNLKNFYIKNLEFSKTRR